jgi:hypothetical protein
MAPTDTSKWAVHPELVRTRFLDDEDVSNAMRLTAGLAGQ